jgi:hypothetical protein
VILSAFCGNLISYPSIRSTISVNGLRILLASIIKDVFTDIMGGIGWKEGGKKEKKEEKECFDSTCHWKQLTSYFMKIYRKRGDRHSLVLVRGGVSPGIRDI